MQYQDSLEIDKLHKIIQELTESKEKYKSRTKQLMSSLEENRLSTHSDARSLAQQTLTMRQLADQRDIEVRKLKNELYQREQEISQLQAENKQLQLSSKQKVVFDKNIEKLAEVQKRSITQAEAECQAEKEFSRVLVKTIQSFLQIFNILGQSGLGKQIPKYAVRIFKDLQQAGDCEILPVFIDQNECSMQILLTTNKEINAPQFSKKQLYQKMYQNANSLDMKQQQDDDFVSFQAYLNKIQSDMSNESDMELKKTYLIQEQNFNMQNIDFIPRKALNVLQNFIKIQRINGLNIRTSEANQLLVQLSAVFHEYCQNLKAYDLNQKISKQNKEIEDLNRKLLLQKPYSIVQQEQQIKRLRAISQKYRDLYEDLLDRKSINKKVFVKIDGESKKQGKDQFKKVEDEIRMLRQLVQTGGIGTNKAYDNEDQLNSQDTVQQINTQGFQYQQGCLVAGRMLMSVIEATLGTLYSMKGTNSDILEQLRKCQSRCRELLMDMLDGNVNDDIDEELE